MNEGKSESDIQILITKTFLLIFHHEFSMSLIKISTVNCNRQRGSRESTPTVIRLKGYNKIMNNKMLSTRGSLLHPLIVIIALTLNPFLH